MGVGDNGAYVDDDREMTLLLFDRVIDTGIRVCDCDSDGKSHRLMGKSSISDNVRRGARISGACVDVEKVDVTLGNDAADGTGAGTGAGADAGAGAGAGACAGTPRVLLLKLVALPDVVAPATPLDRIILFSRILRLHSDLHIVNASCCNTRV